MLTKSKLTLWLDTDSKRFGKSWAKRHKQSVSFLLSSYLQRLKDAEKDSQGFSPVVRRLRDKIVFRASARHEYRAHLEKKYSHA